MQSSYSKSITTKIQQGHQTPQFGHYLTIRMEHPNNPGGGSGRCAACIMEGEVWRHVTMEAKFMDRQRQRIRTNKASKTTTLHADHAFLNISFSCVRKLPNCTMDIIHRWTNFLFFFFFLRYGLFGFNTRHDNFANIWQI